MPLEEWELPDDVSETLSKYRSKITECRKKVELEKNVETNRPVTYLQSRAKKSIDFHDKALESLDAYYDEKKEKLEKALEILLKEKTKLETSLTHLEVEKKQKRLEHEEAIEKAKESLEYKPVALIRAESALEEAIIAKDKYLQLVTNTYQPERNITPPTSVKHPEYKRPIVPIVAPEEKVFLWEGNQVSEWEYNLRMKKFGDGHTHTPSSEGDVCVSPPTPPLLAKSKKPIKIANRFVNNSTEIFSTTPAEQNEHTTSESIPTDAS